MPNEEKIKEIVQTELENLLNRDIDRSAVTDERVREIVREEFPALLAQSSTTLEGHLQLLDSRNIIVGSTTGTKVATATGQKLGFFNQTPAVQQTSAANLTNNVASGGTDDTIANYTDLSTYANDAATIRNDLYQLARKLKQVNDGLRTLGLLS